MLDMDQCQGRGRGLKSPPNPKEPPPAPVRAGRRYVVLLMYVVLLIRYSIYTKNGTTRVR